MAFVYELFLYPINVYRRISKMLSYRRETALQGASVLAKSI